MDRQVRIGTLRRKLLRQVQAAGVFYALIAVASGWVLLAGCASQATIIIPTISGEARLRFDPSRISERRLFELAKVGPYRPEEFNPPSLELCRSRDPEYRDCGSRKIAAPNFLYNADVNLARGQQMLESLDQLKPPQELHPVFIHVRREVSFYLCLRQAQLAYYRGYDQALNASCEGIDAIAVCSIWVAEAPFTKASDMRHSLAGYTWYNCMHSEFRERLGDYPGRDWQRFLNALASKRRSSTYRRTE